MKNDFYFILFLMFVHLTNSGVGEIYQHNSTQKGGGGGWGEQRFGVHRKCWSSQRPSPTEEVFGQAKLRILLVPQCQSLVNIFYVGSSQQ